MKRLLATALAVSLVAGSITTAFADGRDRDHDSRRDNDRHEQRDNRHDDRRTDNRHDHGRWDNRDHHPGNWQHYDGGRYYRPYNYHYYSWRRGDRLPTAYYAPRYVVNNYGAYRLRPPPHGYHWVRVENDVLLTAVATGVVLEVVSDLFN